MRLIKKPVEVSFDKFTAKEYYTGIVRAGSQTSARVNLPLSLTGKKVIVIVVEDDKKKS
jgi:putative transposon-encoded protein